MTSLFTVHYEHVPLVVPDKPNKPSNTPAFEHHVVFVMPPNANFRSYMLHGPIVETVALLALRKHEDYRLGKPETFWPEGVKQTYTPGSYGFTPPAHTRLRVRFHNKEHAMLFRLSFPH